jgi:hypothetical protein
MEVTTGTVGDTTQLGTLLESLDDIDSVSGDTGYLSHRNCMLVEAKGATPYHKPRRQPRTAYRPTSLETHDTILQAKPTRMDETLTMEDHYLVSVCFNGNGDADS